MNHTRCSMIERNESEILFPFFVHLEHFFGSHVASGLVSLVSLGVFVLCVFFPSWCLPSLRVLTIFSLPILSLLRIAQRKLKGSVARGQAAVLTTTYKNMSRHPFPAQDFLKLVCRCANSVVFIHEKVSKRGFDFSPPVR